jgi:hypothetical protein
MPWWSFSSVYEPFIRFFYKKEKKKVSKPLGNTAKKTPYLADDLGQLAIGFLFILGITLDSIDLFSVTMMSCVCV